MDDFIIKDFLLGIASLIISFFYLKDLKKRMNTDDYKNSSMLSKSNRWSGLVGGILLFLIGIVLIIKEITKFLK